MPKYTGGTFKLDLKIAFVLASIIDYVPHSWICVKICE